eukprot:scaffold275153_cov42-Prasinocladus_malaysianus.AAC.1
MLDVSNEFLMLQGIRVTYQQAARAEHAERQTRDSLSLAVLKRQFVQAIQSADLGPDELDR